MAKKIAFCCDGTWDNTATKTNVYRLYKALPTTAAQLPFYDDGVGSDGLAIDRLVGGAFGIGLHQKIKDAYKKIAHVYEEGDDIFLFGFSRGAYTARSVAGMIAVCGMPTKDWDDNLVETAFSGYRAQAEERRQILAKLDGCSMYDAKIKMIGVWDTVGSLGIPSIIGGVDPVAFGFLDTSLHEDVLNAYHAVAIDEKRCEFPATLWTRPYKPEQTVEQVYFCGVHGDVGGGYVVDGASSEGLADITLGWIMTKACALGLNIDSAVEKQYTLPLDAKYALDQIHETWSPFWGFPQHRPIESDACIADSVVIRCQHHDSWVPKNLELQNGVPASHYSISPVVSIAASA